MSGKTRITGMMRKTELTGITTNKHCLKEHFSTIILLSINHSHTDSRMLHFLCVCVYVLFFSPLFCIFFIVYRVCTFLFFLF